MKTLTNCFFNHLKNIGIRQSVFVNERFFAVLMTFPRFLICHKTAKTNCRKNAMAKNSRNSKPPKPTIETEGGEKS